MSISWTSILMNPPFARGQDRQHVALRSPPEAGGAWCHHVERHYLSDDTAYTAFRDVWSGMVRSSPPA